MIIDISKSTCILINIEKECSRFENSITSTFMFADCFDNFFDILFQFAYLNYKNTYAVLVKCCFYFNYVLYIKLKVDFS